MRVLVCGSRDWQGIGEISARLRELPRGTVILHGGARGADSMAGTIASGLGFEVREYPADWKRLGRSAGARRSFAMLDERPDLVLAFHRRGSRGTALTVHEARRRGIPVEVIAA